MVFYILESEAALPQLPEGVPSNQIEGERTGSAENPFLCKLISDPPTFF